MKGQGFIYLSLQYFAVFGIIHVKSSTPKGLKQLRSEKLTKPFDEEAKKEESHHMKKWVYEERHHPSPVDGLQMESRVECNPYHYPTADNPKHACQEGFEYCKKDEHAQSSLGGYCVYAKIEGEKISGIERIMREDDNENKKMSTKVRMSHEGPSHSGYRKKCNSNEGQNSLPCASNEVCVHGFCIPFDTNSFDSIQHNSKRMHIINDKNPEDDIHRSLKLPEGHVCDISTEEGRISCEDGLFCQNDTLSPLGGICARMDDNVASMLSRSLSTTTHQTKKKESWINDRTPKDDIMKIIEVDEQEATSRLLSAGNYHPPLTLFSTVVPLFWVSFGVCMALM